MKLLNAVAVMLWFVPCAASNAGDQRTGHALFHGDQHFAAGSKATSINLPASFAACSSCHGELGSGSNEGNITAPFVRYEDLRSPSRSLPPFGDDAAIAAAIVHGVARDGQQLAALMPRYNVSPDEMQSLLAYLKVAGTASDLTQGVTETEIRFGTLLPLSGPQGKAGRDAREGMAGTFAKANQLGGVYGRKIIFIVQDNSTDPDAAARALASQSVYAVVGGLWPAASATETILGQARVSTLASLTVQTSKSIGTWSSNLLPPRDLTEGLAAQAKQSCSCSVTIVSDEKAGDQVVLPFPASVLAEGNIWQNLGRAAARTALESLSVAGTVLHRRSALDALENLSGFEPLPGAPVLFAKSRRYAWDPSLLDLRTMPQQSTAARRQQ